VTKISSTDEYFAGADELHAAAANIPSPVRPFVLAHDDVQAAPTRVRDLPGYSAAHHFGAAAIPGALAGGVIAAAGSRGMRKLMKHPPADASPAWAKRLGPWAAGALLASPVVAPAIHWGSQTYVEGLRERAKTSYDQRNHGLATGVGIGAIGGGLLGLGVGAARAGESLSVDEHRLNMFEANRLIERTKAEERLAHLRSRQNWQRFDENLARRFDLKGSDAAQARPQLPELKSVAFDEVSFDNETARLRALVPQRGVQGAIRAALIPVGALTLVGAGMGALGATIQNRSRDSGGKTSSTTLHALADVAESSWERGWRTL